MKQVLHTLTLAMLVVVLVSSTLLADDYLEGLQPGQIVHGFKTVNLYDNNSGKALGARFISEKYGFIVDLMQIQSVPQAFYWVKTPITSSKGEPHACEHLLLGKGNRGRYVAALEDMALGSSSAYTSQATTCYHFNTVAGEDTFYKIFEAKLQALLHPDFTDEEIRREVCHIGVTVNPQDSSLSLEEKGTVYTEMVSAFERPWYYTWSVLNKLIYGDKHPLSMISGGDPDVMRGMTPADMWKFHQENYHLANMGAICSIPSEITVESFLTRMDEILGRCQKNADSSALMGIGAFDFPPPTPAPVGTSRMVTYPSSRPEDPGYFLYAWPNDLNLDYKQEAMLSLFLQTFAGGETSDLYNLFINSQTRKIDLGGNSVYGGYDSDLGISVYFGLDGVDNSRVTETMVDSVRALIISAVQRIHDLPDGSEALAEFNRRAGSRLEQERKQTENNLNQPPMFGFRSGPAGAWLNILKELEKEPGFHKSLMFKSRFTYADSLLNLDKNIWKDFIDQWRLLTVVPYSVGVTPSPDITKAKEEAKQARLAAYEKDFEDKYDVENAQLAIARYKEDFDAKTAELEELASHDKLPGFIENPPMTLDDQLNYEIIDLPGDIPFVASTFENMTSSRIGLALRMESVPESLLVYVPFLPSALTDIGVTKEGELVRYDEMQERLRHDVLNLSSYFTSGRQGARVELVLSGDGGNTEELNNALAWMDAALYSPYLSVENIPRMLDLIDQALVSLRNRTQNSEEYWVSIPAYAYRTQKNPLAMSTDCFFTQVHHYQRLRWQLTDPGDEDQRQQLGGFIDLLFEQGQGKSREELTTLLSRYESAEALADIPGMAAFNNDSRNIVVEIARAFKVSLDDIPEASLAHDWAYLCRETKADLMVTPATAIAGIRHVLDLVRRQANARMYMISNSRDRQAALATIRQFVEKLDPSAPADRQEYAPIDRITQRLAEREPGIEAPVYVGLVHDGSQNGVLVFTAKVAGEYDTSETATLNCLAGRLYSGGGPHGLFMHTWAAGLAYSNGYGYSDASGRASYYAERCPDVAETMRFVVGLLNHAEDDSTLVDYAVAQVFGYSRAPSRYEQRGQAMAADLADGYTPERVRAYRQKVLDLRGQDGLYEKLRNHMADAYGPVLIGYGRPLAESQDGAFFMIGPEAQFESLERYIETSEGKQTVYRLYPRDFWLTI